MSRTATPLFRSLGRLRVPTLAFVAGVGFFVSGLRAATGPIDPLVGPPPSGGAAFEMGHAGPVQALHPSPGLTSLGPMGQTHLVKRLPGGRGPGPSDAGAPRHRETGDARPTPAWRPGTPRPITSAAAGVYARSTARRLGRLSAPSTAPPASPF